MNSRRSNPPIELVENFYSQKAYEEIPKILVEIVQARKGKVVSCLHNLLQAKFGSKIMVRFFGAVILSMFMKSLLPHKIEINIEPMGDKNRIVIRFSDNLGRFIYRDPWTQSIYNEYFTEFSKEIRKNLT